MGEFHHWDDVVANRITNSLDLAGNGWVRDASKGVDGTNQTGVGVRLAKSEVDFVILVVEVVLEVQRVVLVHVVSSG